MDAWGLLGWILNAIAFTILAVVFYTVWVFGLGDVVTKWVRNGWKHQVTRHIPPEPGQVWSQDGAELEVLSVENGRVCIRNRWAGTSWCDSPYQWEQRMKERKLWLISGPSNGVGDRRLDK